MNRGGIARLAAVAIGLSLSCSPAGNDATPGNDPGEVARFRAATGPLEELRVRLDTAGGLVVWGFCYFPERTSLTVVVHDSAGTALARTQPTVENSLFQSLPLRAPGSAAWPPGRYEIQVHATFAPGAQPERVLRESRGGEAFTGDGMVRTRQGRPAYDKRFVITLPPEAA